jgi:hypothetical protein
MPRLEMMSPEDVLPFYLNRVDAIDGWFPWEDMVAFYLLIDAQIRLDQHGDLCELGSHYGKSAAALYAFSRATETLHLFEFRPETAAATLATLFEDTAARLRLHPGDLRAVQAPPRGAVSRPIRFLHVDAGHSHREVLNDLNNFAPLVTPGGVIALDDWFNRHWPGVATAGTEFMLSPAGTDFRPFLGTAQKLYLCRRDLVPVYQRIIGRAHALGGLSMENVLDAEVIIAFSASAWDDEELDMALGLMAAAS